MTLRATYHTLFHFFDYPRNPRDYRDPPSPCETSRITETLKLKPLKHHDQNMDDSMNTENPRRIIDLVIFQQRFKTNFQNIYEEICEVSKRMEKIENVNQTFRDENQKLTLTNENKNTTIDVFQRKNLVMEDQLKKRLLTPFIVSPQRNSKFLTPNNLVELAMNSNFSNLTSKPNFKPMVIGILPKKRNSITLFRVSEVSPRAKSSLK